MDTVLPHPLHGMFWLINVI